MDKITEATSFEWTAQYLQALGSLNATVDKQQFLDDLVRVSLSMSGADNVYGILMEKDTVVAELGHRASGGQFEPEDSTRKAAARIALASTRSSDAAQVESLGEATLIPFAVTGGFAGALCIEGAQHDLALTAALIFSAASTLNARLELADANNRATVAEDRIREVETAVAAGGVGAVAYLKPVAELERDAIELALRTTKWNKEEAARRLGISRASIYMKVKKFGLQKPI